ncbi:Sec34-like family-domain-containing protein [Cladochytrium replicatum]|nr:Sec34-like family-domain-containing protein [Cladochytrium replicatum]
MDDPIETTQQFFTWFSKIEEEMERGQEDVYRTHLASVRTFANACDGIIEKLNEMTRLLDELMGNYRFVEDKSKALQTACEKLLAEQTHLEEVADMLEEKLQYFNELEPVMKLFSSSGDVVCLDDKFVPMLVKLDHSIAFVQSHMSYKDSDLYLMRFRQCMTRGMTLIKFYVATQMKMLQAELKERLSQRGPNEPFSGSLQTSLFYVKFRTLAARLKPLIAEIEIRIEGHREYIALLNDCMQSYFAVRLSVLAPYVRYNIEAILNQESDLLTFARQGSAYIINLCADEFALFYQYFSFEEGQLLSYLDSLSGTLSEYLRPLILREQRIEVLSALCQTLYILQHSAISAAMGRMSSASGNGLISPSFLDFNGVPGMGDEGFFDDEDGGGIVSDDQSSAVRYVVKKILEDAQSRLVFRAQSFIRSEIAGFKPRQQELSVLARGRGLPQPMPLALAVGVDAVLGTPERFNGTGDDWLNSKHPEQTDAELVSEDSSVLVPLNASSGENTEEEHSQRESNKYELAAIAMGKLVYGGGEWYPTLQRTLYILGKLYRCVPNSVFEDLAQEAVDLCRVSLLQASAIISGTQTKLDGQFFLIKNFLMLREQIAPFEISFVRKEEVLDFHDLLNAASSLLSPTTWGVSSITALSKGILSAKVVQSLSDSKQAVDNELKRVCEEFILETAKACVEPISSYMLKVSAFKITNESKPRPSREPVYKQSFAHPSNVVAISEEFKDSLSKRLQFAIAKMTDYLGDKKTEGVLVRVIQSNIIETYRAFYETVSLEYVDGSGRDIDGLISKLAPVEEVERWIAKISSSVFSKRPRAGTHQGSAVPIVPPAAGPVEFKSARRSGEGGGNPWTEASSVVD